VTQNREETAQWLTARLAELDERVTRIENEQQEPLDADSGERAIAREDDEPLDALELAALLEIAQTQQALTRLAMGKYGLCTSCGDAIAPARLEAMPAAALCVNCAASGAHISSNVP
jgi:DnaK suppressor protein